MADSATANNANTNTIWEGLYCKKDHVSWTFDCLAIKGGKKTTPDWCLKAHGIMFCRSCTLKSHNQKYLKKPKTKTGRLLSVLVLGVGCSKVEADWENGFLAPLTLHCLLESITFKYVASLLFALRWFLKKVCPDSFSVRAVDCTTSLYYFTVYCSTLQCQGHQWQMLDAGVCASAVHDHGEFARCHMCGISIKNYVI